MADEPESTGEELPQAGWFADPERPGQLRWWDGTRWTEHRTADPTAAPAAAWRESPQRGPVAGTDPPRTSGWAIASLVSGLFLPILGIVFGLIARRRIKDSGGTLAGLQLANAGVALAAFGIAIGATLFALGEFTDHTNSDRYKGADKPVAALVDDVETALAKHQGSRACGTLFTKILANRIATGSGQSCDDFVSDAVANGEFQARIDVKSIEVTGRTARVEVTEGDDPQIWSLELAGGVWRVDEISA